MQNFAPLAPVADECVKRNQETKSEDRDGKKFHSRVKCLRKKKFDHLETQGPYKSNHYIH